MPVLDTISNLFQNKLFLSYLSGTGAAIADPNISVAGGLDKITQDNIAAESQHKLNQQYIKMLKGMFAGNVPQNAKLTIDQKGATATMPKPVAPAGASTPESMVEQPYIQPDPGTLGPRIQGAPAANDATNRTGGRLANPFSPSPQSELTASDFAGLNAQDVSRALSGATNVAQVQSIAGQRGVTQQIKLMDAMRRWNATGPVDLPGRGPVTLDEWKGLDAKTKAYSYYAFDQKQRGEGILSFDEWETQVDPTTMEQQWRLALKEPKFKEFLLEQKKAGRSQINIGDKLANKEAMGRLEDQLKVRDPDFNQNVMQDLQKDTRAWRFTIEAEARAKEKNISFDEARDDLQRKAILLEMDKRIRSAYDPKTVVMKLDGWYIDGKRMVRNPYVR